MAADAACARVNILNANLSAASARANDRLPDFCRFFESRAGPARPANSAMTNPVPAANSNMPGEVKDAWSRSPNAARRNLTACLRSATCPAAALTW
jgi:hypothetical protein